MFVLGWKCMKLCFRCNNLHMFEHRLSSAQRHVWRTIFFFRPFKLKYKMYSSLMPLSILELFIFPVFFFALYVLTCSCLYEKITRFIGKRQSKWERAVLYWYLQYFDVVNRATVHLEKPDWQVCRKFPHTFWSGPKLTTPSWVLVFC